MSTRDYIEAEAHGRFDVVPDVHKIAVLQPKALGDFIVAIPALKALKARYPDAELCFLGKPWHADFLRGRPSPIDRVIVVPPSEGVRNEPEKKGVRNAPSTREDPEELADFFGAMQAERFDVALHFLGSGGKANPFLNRLRARVTAGMRKPSAEAIDRYLPYVHYQCEVLRFLEIVGLVGAKPVELEPQLTIATNDCAAARAALGRDRDQPLVVLHPGSDQIQNRWPAENFAALADELASHGCSIVLTGTDREQEILTEISSRMHAVPVDTCGQLTLRGLAGMLSLARLVVTNNTGPLHLAQAVGAATVGIFWLPDVINWSALSRRRHRIVVSRQLGCPVCGTAAAFPWPFEPVTSECSHSVSFTGDVQVDEVFRESLDLLRT
jgi:ADP-heptose:LPS heptosyltransferase